ncbi:MAG: hypothetical protein LBB98_02280 [Treponema sp.]|jgi:formate hydrogenlyase subunit 3/multisubunit Na+/H+ antiporter MnhD subunit|nr:hypothetical protein [Treponema sp.]
MALIPLPFIALAFILYFAVSKKSSPMVRRLAVIALILAAVVLIVSVIFIVTASPQEAESGPITLPLPVKPVTPVQKVNWQELIVFGLFFALFLLFLFAFSRRDAAPKAKKEKAPYRDDPDDDAWNTDVRGDDPPGRERRRRL